MEVSGLYWGGWYYSRIFIVGGLMYFIAIILMLIAYAIGYAIGQIIDENMRLIRRGE